MKILWVSDSPTSPSGFGAVTRAVCRRLVERGHHVEIVGWQTRGAVTRWEGIPVHPVRRDLFGSDVLLGYLMRTRPDFLVTLADVWWLSFLADPPVQQFLDLSGSRWVLYYPVDGADPEGRLPPSWVRMLEAVDVPVAMSRFGVAVTRASGLECAYIPHGCELDVFRPPADKHGAKARLGYEDRFGVLSDARNQPRKLLPRLLDVFARFAADKDDVLLHMHCDPDDDAAMSELYAYRLREDVELLGLGDKVRFTTNFRMRTSGGLDEEQLAAIYQAADVHLLTSWGEGFGLPTLQAASAGVVPIAVDYTASRELVGRHGFAVSAESSVLDEFGLVRAFLNREGAATALGRLYRDPAELADRSRRSREFALSYGWDALADRWEQVLLEAPARRRPQRTRTLAFTGSTVADRMESDTLPEPVAAVVGETVARLPGGSTVTFQMAERRFGEVSAEIKRDAYAGGEAISIPVRLRPLFEGCPRAAIGHLLVSPSDLPVAGALKRLFPSLAFSIPKASGDVEHAPFLSLEQLLPTLPHYALVIDRSREAAQGVDVACAALGVPYLGPSDLWPAPAESQPVLAIRELLTDPGLAEWRREVAAGRLEAALGTDVVDRIRAAALEGQPEPQREPAPAAPDDELFLVRPVLGAPADAVPRIERHAASLGGLVLLRTGRGALVVTLPPGGKEELERSTLVGFVGGITLDDDTDAARGLKKAFARNALDQMHARPPAAAAGERR